MLKLKRAWALSMAAGALAVGCSLFLDLDYAPCTSTEECRGRGGRFADTVCGAGGLCVAGQTTSEPDADTPVVIPCTTNVECRDKLGGVPAACNRVDPETAFCAPLENERCKVFDEVVPQNWESNDAVVFGMFELGDEGRHRRVRAAALAFDEINRFGNGGLPSVADGKNRRPIVLVNCVYDESAVEADVDHLKNAGVQGIIGVGSSGPYNKLTSYSVPRKIFTIGTTGASPEISTDQAGLSWRISPSAAHQATVLRDLARETEERVRADLSIEPAPTGKIKLSTLVVEGFGQALLNVFQAGFTFNEGNSTITSPEYLRYTVPDDVAGRIPSQEYKAAIDAIIAHQPHVIVVLAPSADFFERLVVGRIESGWTASYRPEWLFNEYAVLGGVGASSYLNANPDVAARIRGIYPRSIHVGYDEFVDRYTQKFPTDSELDLQYPYDAAYVLAYAAYAGAPTKPFPTGIDISEGARKLLPRGSVDVFRVGPIGERGNSDEILRAFGALRAGGINLEGVTNNLNFEAQIGELDIRESNLQVFCFGHCLSETQVPRCTLPGADGGLGPLIFRESGRSYDGTKLTGTFDCP